MGDATRLSAKIIGECERNLHYAKRLDLPQGESKIDVTCAFGENATCPVGATDQPDKFPLDSFFALDAKFFGTASFEPIA